MPKLPDYTALGERAPPNVPSGVASYTPADPTTFSRGMTQAGGELSAAADVIAQTNQRQDIMTTEAAVNRLQAKRLELELGDGGFQTVKGGAAVGQQFLDGYDQKFKAASDQVLDSLQNDNQRRLFQQKMPVAQLQFRSALLKHQAQQTDLFNDQTEKDTIDLARRQIFTNPGDPQALDAGLAQINWAIDQRGKRLGWSAPVADETKRKFTEAVMGDMAAMQVERDPVTALAAINKRMGVGTEQGPSGVTAIDAINVNELVKLRHRAASYVAQADNQARAEAEKRLRAAESATKELQTFALSGQMPSQDYEREVLGAVSGTPFEEPARAMLTASYSGATHGSLPLPDQEKRLRALDLLLAGNGSSPEDSKLATAARAITENQRQAYKENPWAAATRFGRQMDVPQAQITDAAQVPQLIAQRLPMMTGVETFAGRPVSPLQPDEAGAFAQQLGAMPPEARAEVLAQTGAMLSAPRATALADQLDKKDRPLALALKMGLDRTTAGRAASSLVLRGAQAISDKTVKKDDTALAGWKAEIAGLVRGSIGDDQAESDVIDAAYYVRAAQEQEGIAPAGFKSSGNGAADAVAMVAGTPITRAGVKTLLPRGMQESDFDNRLKAAVQKQVDAASTPPGMIERGNIDLAKRPQVKNSDGSVSTVRSMGINVDGQEVLIPTVSDDGRIMGNQEAVDTYMKTGRHLGKFTTPQASTAYAQALHSSQEAFYTQGRGSPEPQATVYVRGAPVPMRQIMNHITEYGLKRDGAGRYIPVVRSAPVTLDPQGQQMLRLDVK